MKNFLIYQSSEYDCGPVSLINGIRYLFDREEIFPDVIKFIMLYCMDTYNEAGELCKHGTSAAAMNFVASWLNHFSQVKPFPIRCEFLSGEVRRPFRKGIKYMLPWKKAALGCRMFFWKWAITCFSPELKGIPPFFLILIMRKRARRNSMRNISTGGDYLHK